MNTLIADINYIKDPVTGSALSYTNEPGNSNEVKHQRKQEWQKF